MGGRLSLHAKEWRNIPDKLVSRFVQEGLTIEFKEGSPPPDRYKVTPSPQDPVRAKVFREEITSLLGKKAIEKIPGWERKDGYYCNLFLVDKASGGFRPVLNLKPLNNHVVKRSFKMESLKSILAEMRVGDWACTIDLRDAFFHVPVHPVHRRFLRFSFEGQGYQFRALPFGLSSAPRIFTRVAKSVLSILRSEGIRIHAYLDDWIILASSPGALIRARDRTLSLLQSMGFLVNWEKSQLRPTQHLQYLGAQIDLKLGIIFPSAERLQSIHTLSQDFMGKTHVKASHFLRLLGTMNSCIGLIPYAHLHMRPIQLYLLAHWSPQSRDLDFPVPIEQFLIPHVQWWLHHKNTMAGCQIHPPHDYVHLTTDSSPSGWGAHFRRFHASGVWSSEQRSNHINWLELKAIQLALQKWEPHFHAQNLMIHSDNSTVVAYLNKEGGTRSATLCYLTWEILQWCRSRRITIRCSHIPGKKNHLADMLSRKNQVFVTEWTLNRQVVRDIFRMWGRPHIDLFATNLNHQLPIYVSPVPDPHAWAVDALAIDWTGLDLYAYPPITLIPTVIRKLSHTRCSLILIAPNWPSSPWFPTLMSLKKAGPYMLPLRPDLLRQPHNGWIHQSPQSLQLAAWRL